MKEIASSITAMTRFYLDVKNSTRTNKYDDLSVVETE